MCNSKCESFGMLAICEYFSFMPCMSLFQISVSQFWLCHYGVKEDKNAVITCFYCESEFVEFRLHLCLSGTLLLFYLWLWHHTAPSRDILLHTVLSECFIRWQRSLTIAFLCEHACKEVNINCNVFIIARSELLLRPWVSMGGGWGDIGSN